MSMTFIVQNPNLIAQSTMWFLWLYLSAIFGTLHGAISDIECGQNTLAVAPKGEIVYFE